MELSNSHLSALCNHKDGVNTIQCKLGKIIKGTFGTQPNWDLNELSKLPDSALTKSIKVVFTIQKDDGKIIKKTYDSMNQGSIELGAQNSAVKWIRRGEKYKSTKCNFGRIIKVEDL